MNIENAVIEDICDFVGGSQPPKSVFKSELNDGYIRFIQIRDYKADSFITYIPIDTARKFCNKEDVMIGRYGPPIFQILRGIEGAYNVALMKAVPKSNVLNDYLYFLLKQKAVFEYVDSLSLRTGGQTGVDLYSLNQYPILLPDLLYQKKVVDVLNALDSKIELNNRINRELEQMAKLLYDYWFVQFEFPFDFAQGKPCTETVEGRGYKSSGGQMVWNEELKREIPEGWKVGNLSCLGDIIGGSTPPREINDYFSKNGTAWITPKDLSLNKGNKFITKGEWDVSEKGIKVASLNIMPKGTVLFSSRAPIGYLAISREEVTTNQGFKSFISNKGFSTEYIYYTIKNLIPTIENHAVGSTFKEISSGTLKTIKTCLPEKSVVEKFTHVVTPIFERQNLLELENQQLVSLRDWLLPMLMNGQLTSTSSVTGDELATNKQTSNEVKEEMNVAAEPGENV
ncbi:MAG TPA: restriction endonuclease subunit S [Prolixibacteraceae bacterium]|nr:restriction endonuclease subunit S [Prolixibacteraceae bacterium]